MFVPYYYNNKNMYTYIGGNSTGGPKRAGRRPLEKTVPSDAPLDPKQKRKEQNRAAQRAFRERKERHVTELQERIRELEEENASHSHLAEENALLKEQLLKLQEENYTLKGTPFTFEFPPKTAGIIHDDEYQYRSSNSTTSDSCGSLSVTGDKSSTSSNNSESPSMTLDHLSSLEEDDDEEREAEKDQLHQQQQIQQSTHEQQQQQQQQQQPQPQPQLEASSSSSSSSPQQQTEQQQQDLLNQAAFTSFQNGQELSIDDLLAPFANNTDNFFTNTATTFQNNNMLSKDQFAFTDYRVPQSADNFLFQADLPPLFGGDVDLFGLSAPAPNNDNIDPITLTNISNPFTATTSSSPTSPATPPIAHTNSGCNILNQLREAKGQNPKAMEIDRQLKNYCPDFDLDNLCWELKEKAKCSENRFSEKDMGHIIDYFEKKGDCESGK
ncbi:hypothetical protein BDC45DRAFT_58118 [Circinella umbellata]|nr:hypothetical protein BDC45DRAFT_58118 [Circinella umbellata]